MVRNLASRTLVLLGCGLLACLGSCSNSASQTTANAEADDDTNDADDDANDGGGASDSDESSDDQAATDDADDAPATADGASEDEQPSGGEPAASNDATDADEPVSSEADQPSQGDPTPAETTGSPQAPDAPAEPDSDTPSALETLVDEIIGEPMPALAASPASLGAGCESDDDCDGETTCLTEDLDTRGGTIAGGMCTLRCEQNYEVCGATGVCAGTDNGTVDTVDDVAYCLDTCVYTDPNPKCSGLRNRACVLVDGATGLGVCDAKCVSDGDCDSGFCDPFLWVCVAEEPDGAADGSLCTIDADCRGQICTKLTTEDEQGVCVSECIRQADTAACHRDIGSTEPVPSACLPPPPLLVNDIAIGVNDLGICLPTCSDTSPCQHPDWTCLEASAAVAADLGHYGLCVPSALIAPPEEPAPEEEPEPEEPAPEEEPEP